MERSLALLAAQWGPERRAQPAGRAVGMLGWMGEAMAQVLRKVGEPGRSPCASLSSLCKRLLGNVMLMQEGPDPSLPFPGPPEWGNFPAVAGGGSEGKDQPWQGLGMSRDRCCSPVSPAMRTLRALSAWLLQQRRI